MSLKVCIYIKLNVMYLVISFVDDDNSGGGDIYIKLAEEIM
jgi:hypothetical protein